ncbi:CoF synthetase [Wukongibacter baidiensis]|uniref:F390 synthetase-related protein n=1 Tax=Wukongibacter baidiensis TaxID=1723361 RepID=UPI003D7FEFAF
MIEKLIIAFYFIRTRFVYKFRTRKKIEDYQKRGIKKHIDFLKRNSEFYKKDGLVSLPNKSGDSKPLNLKEKPIVDGLENFVIMNKEKMMDNFDRLSTVGIKKEEAFSIALNGERSRDFRDKINSITVGMSSGTSGNRGLFIASKKERAMWAGFILAKGLPKGRIFNSKIAFFLRANSNLYETINSNLIKFKYFDIYSNMSENIETLDKYKPTILVAPPSVLIQLADAVGDKRLNINPAKIISVAEVLEEKDEKYIKKAFNKEIIHQIYQCTEGLLAMTCEFGNLHVNEELVYIEKEIIEGNRFVPIITDYVRRSQPIVRYRLNDILIESKRKCKCGSSFMILEKIEGREDDVFICNSKDNSDEVTVFSDFIRRCFFHVNEVRNYRVVQEKKEEITVYIDMMEDNCKAKIVKEFEKLSKDLNFIMPTINFEKYSFDNSRKLKRVEGKIGD